MTNTDDIQHPAIREAMKMLNMQEIRLTYEADLPARSGLGTSSLCCGYVKCFLRIKGKYADKENWLMKQSIWNVYSATKQGDGKTRLQLLLVDLTG